VLLACSVRRREGDLEFMDTNKHRDEATRGRKKTAVDERRRRRRWWWGGACEITQRR